LLACLQFACLQLREALVGPPGCLVVLPDLMWRHPAGGSAPSRRVFPAALMQPHIK
jgi:hypothetical protein